MALNQFHSAAALAAATPDSRNRYADFLRAIAISAVVLGHWLMAAVWVDESGFHADNILSSAPATQWLTWALQVMPLFFLVGGFSNAVGWKRYEGGYGDWLHTRLHRLVMPTVPLIGLWSVLGLLAPQFGLDPRLARLGSQVALVPLWFLAVYVLMVAATPLTVTVWARYRGRAVLALAAAAIGTDIVRSLSTGHVGFINYVFVWGAVYLLGHAWQDGAFGEPRRARQLAALGGIALVAMTVGGPYHISMVGVPGVEFGNTAPPSSALLALGFTQIGLALSVEGAMRRFLQRPGPWAATIVVNSSIMTLYVWHMTAMALTIGLILLVFPAPLAVVPASAVWWLSRPLWIGLLAIATLPFIVRFRRFEAGSRSEAPARVSPSASIAAAIAVCVSFGSVAATGLTIDHPLWAAAGVIPVLLVGRWLVLSRISANDRELPAR